MADKENKDSFRGAKKSFSAASWTFIIGAIMWTIALLLKNNYAVLFYLGAVAFSLICIASFCSAVEEFIYGFHETLDVLKEIRDHLKQGEQ